MSAVIAAHAAPATAAAPGALRRLENALLAAVFALTISLPLVEMALRGALNETLQLVVPVSQANLAARTAKRAAANDATSTLLPPEVGTRYRQSFVDEERLYARVQEIGEQLLARTGVTLPRSRWPIV